MASIFKATCWFKLAGALVIMSVFQVVRLEIIIMVKDTYPRHFYGAFQLVLQDIFACMSAAKNESHGRALLKVRLENIDFLLNNLLSKQWLSYYKMKTKWISAWSLAVYAIIPYYVISSWRILSCLSLYLMWVTENLA